MVNNTWKLKAASTNKKSKDWLIKILAKNRGLTNKAKLDKFLNPSLGDILSVKLTDIDKAVQRVKGAIESKEKVIVYSDYDADGICATAISWETFFDLGSNVLPYVPHRIKEGYGLSIDAIKELAATGVTLIITVDHGVTATKQIEEAKRLGVDIIVTDHHIPPKVPPKPYALVHSLELCGAGVAWRFCWEIVAKLAPQYKNKLIEKLELAAVATIADLVLLIGANRAIVKIGLEYLAKTKRPGLKSLIDNSGISGPVGTYEIGHILAPRINAMGRIEHGLDSLRLLCAKSQKQADTLAKLLSKTNTRRQDLTGAAVTSAIAMVDEDQLIGVVAHHEWHEGVIGLVASRLVETHHRPMIVISIGQIYSKGSARSIAGFNIVEAIRASSEYLVDAGGHPMAAGFTIETRHIEDFSKKINVYANQVLTDDMLTPIINIECKLEVNDINKQTWQTIKAFEPFGIGNPQPIFLTEKILVEDVRGVGEGNKHLRLQLDGVSAIGFNMGGQRAKLRPGYLMDVVYTMDENRFNGQSQIQMKIKDLKTTDS